MRRGFLLGRAALLTCVALALAGAGPADATVPGKNGRIAFMGLEAHGIFTADPDGSRVRRLTAELDVSPAWSPDGDRIAYVDAVRGNIWKMSPNGEKQRKLTDDGKSYEPSWSPNGRRIAYMSTKGGDPEIFTMRADGGDVQRLTDNDASDLDPRWSPNGRMIVFARERVETLPDLFKISADGSFTKRLTDTKKRYEVAPTWSPGGDRIAFASGRRGDDEEIYKIKSNGSHRTRLTQNDVTDSDPCWSPNGRKIAVYHDGDVARIPASGGNPHVILRHAAWPDWKAR